MRYEAAILSAAAKNNLDPKLVGALIQVESGFQTFAWNPEPKYRYLWDVRAGTPFRRLTLLEQESEVPPSDFSTLAGDVDQEFWGQQASWGLMQIMGAVAREYGFMGPYLPELTEPAVNLAIGCKHLGNLLRWANGNTTQALAAYNGGKGGNDKPPFRNLAYATKVIKAEARLT